MRVQAFGVFATQRRISGSGGHRDPVYCVERMCAGCIPVGLIYGREGDIVCRSDSLLES